jgi:hypothetical protein
VNFVVDVLLSVGILCPMTVESPDENVNIKKTVISETYCYTIVVIKAPGLILKKVHLVYPSILLSKSYPCR